MKLTGTQTARERERVGSTLTHKHTHTREALPLLGWHAPQSQSGHKFENPKSSQRARARARLRGELARHSTHGHTHTHNEHSDAGNQSVDALPPCGAAIFAAHAQSNQSTVCQARRRLPCECRCACACRVVSCGGFRLSISLSLSPFQETESFGRVLSWLFCRGNEVKIRQQVLQSHAHLCVFVYVCVCIGM